MNEEAPPKEELAPYATVSERHVKGLIAAAKALAPQYRTPEDRVPTRVDTVRTGYCPVPAHQRNGKMVSSTRFIGPSENGWLFRCTYGHVFVNRPPL